MNDIKGSFNRKLEAKEVKNTLHGFITGIISAAAWIIIGIGFL